MHAHTTTLVQVHALMHFPRNSHASSAPGSAVLRRPHDYSSSLPDNSWRMFRICRICSGLSGVNDEARRWMCLTSSSSPSEYCGEGPDKAVLSTGKANAQRMKNLRCWFGCQGSEWSRVCGERAHLATHLVPHGPQLLHIHRVGRFP